MSSDLAPDWILKQALETQRKANSEWVSGKPELDDGGLTLTVLGCGSMGTAILRGILKRDEERSDSERTLRNTLSKVPTNFQACVRRPESAKRVKAELEGFNARLKVFENDNLGAIRTGDIILLCCRPQMAADVLQADGMREALAGKLLISICAGFSEPQLQEILYNDEGSNSRSKSCQIVRAIPNAAAAVRESMTIISDPTPPLSSGTHDLVTWIFSRIGRVLHLPASQMDVSTALCGSGPAFVELMLESIVAGSVAMGLPREAAYTMAAQTMRGTVGLLLQDKHPAIIQDNASTFVESITTSLQILEDGMMRDTIADAIRAATMVASQLGTVSQSANRNGPRVVADPRSKS